MNIEHTYVIYYWYMPKTGKITAGYDICWSIVLKAECKVIATMHGDELRREL